MANKSIADLSALEEQTPLIADLIVDTKLTRSQLESRDADEIAEGLQVAFRINWLAIKHQCPSLSRYGFGEDCGEFNPFPDGRVTGILRVNGGTRSCGDAEKLIRAHYFPHSVALEPERAAYICVEDGFVKYDDAPVFIECLPPRGDSSGPSVLVTPAR